MSLKSPIRPVVILESPYRGDLVLNRAYLEACLRDSILKRHEAPIATHKLYTSVLNDNIPNEREEGMRIALSFYPIAIKVVVYYDLGISEGMQWGMAQAYRQAMRIEPRSLMNHPLPREWDDLCEKLAMENLK